MDEQAIQGFLAALWALARLISAAGALIVGLLFFLRSFFPRPKGAASAQAASAAGARKPSADRGPALARRPGLEQLADICAGAKTRGYYRSLVAERLRALARDALALSEDLSEEEAYRRLRTGRGFLSDDEADLLLSDHFATRTSRDGHGARRLMPWLRIRAGANGPGHGAKAMPETPFLTRVDKYLNSLGDYMQGSGGNDGKHKN